MGTTPSNDIPVDTDQIEDIRVLFIHGGGYAKGRDLTQQPFGIFIKEHWKNSHAEHMVDTTDFESCWRQQARAIQTFRPQLIIGRSQGGPIILRLINEGIWNGPAILCCAACVAGFDSLKLPQNVPFLIVNGSKDVAVPLATGHSIMKANEDLGENIKMIIVEDDHSLKSLANIDNSPNLRELVVQLWEMKKKCSGFDPLKNIPVLTKEQMKNIVHTSPK